MKRYTLFIPPEFEDMNVVEFEADVNGEKVLMVPEIEYYLPLQYTENRLGFISAEEGLHLEELQSSDIAMFYISFDDKPLVLH